MLSDNQASLISNIYQYLLGINNVPGLLIKKHTGNLKRHGDMSFPNTIKCWKEYIKRDLLQNDIKTDFLKYVNKDIGLLTEVSKTWAIPLSDCREINDRIHIFLERPLAINICFLEACKNNLSILDQIIENSSLVQVDYITSNSASITELRCKYLANTLQNLCAVHSLTTVKLYVTCKSVPDNLESRTIFVGTVLNATSGMKENKIQSEEFIRIRQEELTLIAQHKYGVRVATDSKWKEFIAHLGESAVTFELLQTKSSSPVKIQFDASGGSSKGAAFILYNCARLETILKTFDDKVMDGSYPPLPDLQDTDLSLLTHEEEWCLIYVYIMGVPTLLKNSVEIDDKRCEFRPHLICNHLSATVKLFSQYYRRVRILTQSRVHLLPVMYARIHMLRTLNDTLKTCLRILNIKSVAQMYLRLCFIFTFQCQIEYGNTKKGCQLSLNYFF